MLVFVIDAAAGNVKRDYAELLDEIGSYNAEILTRPRVVALNKIDLLEGRRSRLKFDVPAVRVSALTGEGVDELRAQIDKVYPAE
jgi:GTP-binding protein